MNGRFTSPIFVRPTASRRSGFTLVEMLAVIVVIAILASILLGALSAAAIKSREARTKSLISKMHNMVMARWDAYRTIRLPISAETSSMGPQFNSKDESQRFRQNVARRRLFALRELIRMEMPDRYEDLEFTPTALIQYGENGEQKPIRPYLWNAYRRKVYESRFRFQQMAKMSISDGEYVSMIRRQYESAECLYLILTTGIDDSSVATEHFTAGDAGDKDQDGMMEFRDAWGNPIEFLRWAPGVDTPAQPLYRYPKGDARYALFHGTQPTDPDDSNVRVSRWQIKVDTITGTTGKATTRLVVIDQDEPLNPLRVGPILDNSGGEFSRWLPGKTCPEYGFLLMPFIYSCGRDQKSGLEHCFGYNPVNHPEYGALSPSDPYNAYQDPSGARRFRGGSTYEGHEYDNLHNHEIVLR